MSTLKLQNYCVTLNSVIADYKIGMTDEGKRALSRNFIRGAQQNSKSLKNLFFKLLLVRSRLLVVRVDFLFRDKFGVESFGESKVYKQVDHDRKGLINAVRSQYGDGLMGYAWKLEYGANRGYHYHMLFIFDGAIHQNDIKIGMHIGNMWRDVTENRGSFHNCNAYKHSYPICGIGMFHHSENDLEKRFNVVVNYLTKADYHCRLILPGKQRSFQTSFCKLSKSNKDRPRKTNN